MEEQEPASSHRDPRYIPGRVVRKSSGPPRTNDVKVVAMRYLLWANWVIVIFVALFVIDYFLPYTESTETVIDVSTYNVRARRKSDTYYYIQTASGKKLDVRFSAIPDVSVGEEIKLWTTWIYRTLMKIQVNGSPVSKAAYPYSAQSFIIYLSLTMTIMSIVFKREHVPFAFNMSIGSIVLFVFYLMFMFKF